MNRSESINELATALAKAQGAMEAAAKDKTNPHFKSKYADLASVWDAIREPLSANGLSVVQLPYEDSQGRISVETMIMHTSGQWMSATYCLPPTQATPQGVGSAITYMKRYALVGLGVAPDDDDGNAASGKSEKPEAISPYSAGPAKNGNGNGNGKHADPGAAAELFLRLSLETIKKINDVETLGRWEDSNRDGMKKLQAIDTGRYAILVEALGDQFARLSPLNA